MKSVVENILKGMDIQTAIKEETNTEKAKPVINKFLQDKHYIDGFVRGYKVVESDAGVDVVLDLVPGQTIEKWLFDHITKGLSNEFHWGGNSKCDMEKNGNVLKIKCRGKVIW